jgi:hypothetical protein
VSEAEASPELVRDFTTNIDAVAADQLTVLEIGG